MTNPATDTLDAALYRDPAIYEAERREIFARGWLLIASESQLPGIGSYVAVTVAGFPLLVVRGKDNVVRGFHNVCRHRAGPLTSEGAGECGEALTCRYHGWRYALDGRLASARDFGPASNFDPREFGLFALKCESWRGFIFVNMDADCAPLDDSLGPLKARAAHLDLERLTRAHLSSHAIHCNWKTYVENFLEGYHIPMMHPSLHQTLEPDYHVEVDGQMQFYHASPRDGAAVAGLWGWMWPCLGVNVYADGILMERMWPVDHANTRLDYLFLFADDVDDAEVQRQIGASAITTGEDVIICEAVQRNLDAGIYTKGRLSPKHEAGIAWFQGTVRAALARNSP